MYEISSKIYEAHGEYQCQLEVWSAEFTTKALVASLYETHLTLPEDVESEHAAIMHLLLTVLRRNAEKLDTPLF